MATENKVATSTSLDVIENDQFVMFGRTSADEHYADGLTQVFFGYPLTKVLLHTTLEPRSNTAREVRRAEQFLTIPTASAIELANIIFAAAKSSEEQLLSDMPQQHREKIRTMLKNYTANSPVAGYKSVNISPTPAKKE